jgi:transaldolase
MPVSLEVISLDSESMYKEGKKLYSMFKESGNVVIKVPVSTAESKSDPQFEGLKTIKKLSSEGIAVNVTLIMSPEQALLAAKAGAKYVSPFAGRIDDHIRAKNEISFEKQDYYDVDEKNHDSGVYCGVHLVENIADIFDNYEFDCEIIAASLRNPRQVRECALANSDIATIPFSVLKNMLSHTKTFEGVSKFKEDVVNEYRNLMSSR